MLHALMMPRMWPCHRLQTVDSTQREALRRIAACAGDSAPFAVWTTAQTDGQGRHGKAWVDSGDALAISVAWPAGDSASRLGPWPLRASLAVAEAISAHWPGLAPHLGVKWPNDILVGGIKAGGVLITRHLVATKAWLVAGIGLNLDWPHEESHEFRACGLRQNNQNHFLDPNLNPNLDLKNLTADKLAELITLAIEAESCRRIPEVSRRFSQFNIYVHQSAVLRDSRTGEVLMRGTVKGVGESGAIELIQPDGSIIHAEIGELSLRIEESLA